MEGRKEAKTKRDEGRRKAGREGGRQGGKEEGREGRRQKGRQKGRGRERKVVRLKSGYMPSTDWTFYSAHTHS